MEAVKRRMALAQVCKRAGFTHEEFERFEQQQSTPFFDASAERKDATAHRRQAPKGTWS